MSKEWRPLWSEITWKVPRRDESPSTKLSTCERRKDEGGSCLSTAHAHTNGTQQGQETERWHLHSWAHGRESDLETGQDSEPVTPAPSGVHPPARPINPLKPHQLGIQYSISWVYGGHQHPLSYVTGTSYFSCRFFVWHRVPSSTGELWTHRVAKGDLELLI